MIELINQLVSDNYPGIMLVAVDGNLYLLLQHHKHTDPVSEARRALLGKINKKWSHAYVSAPIQSLSEIHWS